MENSVSKNILWRFAERFLAQLVSFLVTIVLARILLPEDYGVVAIVNVFIIFADVFVESGFSSALIQKKNVDNLDFSTVLYFNIFFSIILYFILFFCSPVISEFYNNDLLRPVLRILALRIIFAAINSIQQAYIARKMEFKKFFWATLTGTIISAILGIIMAIKGYGVWALVVQYLTNIIVDTIFLSFVIKWKPKFSFSFARLKDLFKYGWKILFEGVSATFSTQIRSLIIGKVYTEEDLGFYSKGEQFPSLIMNNINSSINSVLFPAMSKIQDNDEELLIMMRKSIKVSSYILFPMLFGMSAIASNMILVFLTDKWMSCVPFVYVSCASFFIAIGLYPRHVALKAKGKSGVFMIEHVISRIISLILLFLVYKLSVMAIALCGIASYLILFTIVMYTSKRYNGYRYRNQICDVVGLVFMSVLMFIPTFLIGYFLNTNPIIELLIQVFTGAICYLIMSIVLKPLGFTFIITYIKNFLKNRKERIIKK